MRQNLWPLAARFSSQQADRLRPTPALARAGQGAAPPKWRQLWLVFSGAASTPLSSFSTCHASGPTPAYPVVLPELPICRSRSFSADVRTELTPEARSSIFHTVAYGKGCGRNTSVEGLLPDHTSPALVL